MGGSADEPTWRSAERCDSGQCLEIGTLDESVVVRNSADPSGMHVTIRREAWRAFVAGVKNEEFDDIGSAGSGPSQ